MKFLDMVKGFFNKEAQVVSSAEVVAVSNQTVIESVILPIHVEVVEEEIMVESTIEKVISHFYERINYRYHHSATIQVVGEITNEQAVVGETAIKCGYHPAGYGCWNESFKVVDVEKGIYAVSWTSYDTCD